MSKDEKVLIQAIKKQGQEIQDGKYNPAIILQIAGGVIRMESPEVTEEFLRFFDAFEAGEFLMERGLAKDMFLQRSYLEEKHES